jgi:hypothetical protein
MLIKPRNIRKEDNDDFVGIRLVSCGEKSGCVEAIFPLGYHLDGLSDKKKEIYSLLCLIKKYNKSDNLSNIHTASAEEDDFPFYAYITIIKLFMTMGYYTDTEIQNRTDTKGKINWKKTIKNNKPIVKDDSVLFTKFIVRNNHLNTDNIITKIHEWCVFEAFEKFGWLWTSFTTKKPVLDCLKNPKYYVSILKNELSKTFNDKKKELFTACISILEYKRNSKSQGFYFGTTHFNTVWEGVVDKAYGISQTEKEKYFPHAKWDFVPALQNIKKESSLQPDTIMDIGDGKIFVLDAKYYSFELNPTAVPSATDINKQVRYGAYAQQIEKTKNIYNAFLIPYDFTTNRYNLKTKDEPYAFIGNAYLLNDNKSDDDETYKKILGILVDTKWLIQHATKADKSELAKFIISNQGDPCPPSPFPPAK